jgi:excisionase family DNA binding protein
VKTTPRSFFTISEVADQLQVSTRTIRRKIAAGELAVHNVGRLQRVSRTDLELFMAGRRQGASRYGF